MKMTLDQHETALWSKDGPEADAFRRLVVDAARRFAAATHGPVHVYNAYGTCIEKAGPPHHAEPHPAEAHTPEPPHAEPKAS
jgi:hypothetical protein